MRICLMLVSNLNSMYSVYNISFSHYRFVHFRVAHFTHQACKVMAEKEGLQSQDRLQTSKIEEEDLLESMDQLNLSMTKAKEDLIQSQDRLQTLMMEEQDLRQTLNTIQGSEIMAEQEELQPLNTYQIYMLMAEENLLISLKEVQAKITKEKNLLQNLRQSLNTIKVKIMAE